MAKVLLVEDDNNLREIYEARLTAEGYDIITAQNGEEALSAAKQNKPDLVISDVMMPRISGFEMLDILRNTDELKNTKVIMLTALGQAEDRNRADNLGADKYLVKSQVTLEDIVNAAKELLADEPGQVTVPTVSPAPAPLPTPEPTVVQQVADPVTATPSEPVTTQAAVPTVDPTEPVAPIAMPVTMPEPIATPVDAPVTIPETAPAVIEPALQAETEVEVAEEPSNFVDNVQTATSTTVTVADPDPITQRVSPPAEPLEPEETLPAAQIIAPEQAAPISADLPASMPPVPDLIVEAVAQSESVTTTAPTAEPQTLAAEEAAIEAQIAAFAASDVQPPAPTEVPSANDAILDDAITKLTADPNAVITTAPVEQPIASAEPATSPSDEVAEEPEVAPTPPTDSTSQITGRKVIQPLSDAEAGTTNLDVLLAQEEAKEAAQGESAPQPVVNGQPVSTPPTPGFDPNSIAL